MILALQKKIRKMERNGQTGPAVELLLDTLQGHPGFFQVFLDALKSAGNRDSSLFNPKIIIGHWTKLVAFHDPFAQYSGKDIYTPPTPN